MVLVLIPQIPKALYVIIALMFTFFLLFKLGNFYGSIFKFTGSFLCLAHYTLELIHCFFLIYQYGFIISKISTWFFFLSFSLLKIFISLLRLCIFSFVLRMCVIAQWSIFIMAAMKSLSDNPDICVIFMLASVVFFHSKRLFCFFSAMNDLQLKPGYFRYYVIWLWVSLTPSILAEFL